MISIHCYGQTTKSIYNGNFPYSFLWAKKETKKPQRGLQGPLWKPPALKRRDLFDVDLEKLNTSYIAPVPIRIPIVAAATATAARMTPKILPLLFG